MCEVLDRVEQRGMAQGMALGMQNHAKQTALNLRDRAGITDPALVAGLVEVEVDQVKRWFAENPKR